MHRVFKKHPNRNAANWIGYDNMGAFCEKNRHLFKNDLYDLGCGEKPYKDFFTSIGCNYIGVDWSSSLHNRVADIFANLNEPLPIPDEAADTIISFSVLEHLCEPQTMLNECYRIMKPGGTLVIQVPWQWRVHEAPHDYFRYTPFGLRHLLGKAQFNEISVIPQSGLFTTLAFKINYFFYRLVRGPTFIKWSMKALVSPFCYANLLLACALDILDIKWELEASGYMLIAKKI